MRGLSNRYHRHSRKRKIRLFSTLSILHTPRRYLQTGDTINLVLFSLSLSPEIAQIIPHNKILSLTSACFARLHTNPCNMITDDNDFLSATREQRGNLLDLQCQVLKCVP